LAVAGHAQVLATLGRLRRWVSALMRGEVHVLPSRQMTGLRCVVFVVSLLGVACTPSPEMRVMYVTMPDAVGIHEGTPVNFRGLAVGTVTHLAFEGGGHDGIVASLTISRPDATIRVADRVAVRRNGLFGDNEIQIVPGSASAAVATSGTTLAAEPRDTLSVRQAEVEMAGILRASIARLDSVRGRGAGSGKARR
jgi:ABC-type transporter Mla subunit MlaD